MDKIKTFIKKGNYTKIKIIVAIILSLLVSTIYTVTRTQIIIDRIPIFSVILIFISLHCIIELNKIYEFIYKFRYYLALGCLTYGVIMSYSLSSIGIYNGIIQGEANEKYFNPILGISRGIRSDEWVVNTPIFISQAVDSENRFAYQNDNLRGTKTDMFSVVAPPVLDVLTLARPFNMGFLILGAERGLSFLWLGKWISLALISFEFCMLITNKKKFISMIGMLAIVFSAATTWWNWTDVHIWAMLALLLIDRFMQTKKLKIKLLCALGIFISAISYVFIMYPAWQLPFGYIYLALFIWVCYKNKDIYKINIKDIFIIFLVILMVAGIGIRYVLMSKDALELTMNTDYPGQRFEIGGQGAKVLFSYVYSYVFPFVGVDNPCEFAGMLSFYPIPMILAIIYLIKNKVKKDELVFIIPLLFLGIIFSIFSLFETNELFAKLTLLYMVPGHRLAVPLGFIQIILMIYVLGKFTNDTKWIKSQNLIKIFSIVLSIFIFSIAAQTGPLVVFGALKSYIYGLVLLIFIYLLFTSNKETNRRYLLILLAGMAIVTGATVNPIQKGISVLTEKPVAKKVQEIVKQDSENNLWITDNAEFHMSNYLLCSGAKVVNSTNTYPNFELFEKLLGEDAKKENIRKIYNRYANVVVEITKNKNDVELVYGDRIKIYITPEKLSEIGVGYIFTTRNLDDFNSENIMFNEEYNEKGIMIYKLEKNTLN